MCKTVSLLVLSCLLGSALWFRASWSGSRRAGLCVRRALAWHMELPARGAMPVPLSSWYNPLPLRPGHQRCQGGRGHRVGGSDRAGDAAAGTRDTRTLHATGSRPHACRVPRRLCLVHTLQVRRAYTCTDTCTHHIHANGDMHVQIRAHTTHIHAYGDMHVCAAHPHHTRVHSCVTRDDKHV